MLGRAHRDHLPLSDLPLILSRQTASVSAVEHAENGESIGSMTRSPDRRLTDEDYGGPADRRSSNAPEPCAIET